MHRICMLAFLGFCSSTSAGAQTQELILPVALNGYTIHPRNPRLKIFAKMHDTRG